MFTLKLMFVVGEKCIVVVVCMYLFLRYIYLVLTIKCYQLYITQCCSLLINKVFMLHFLSVSHTVIHIIYPVDYFILTKC